jgi:hypothetical protein
MKADEIILTVYNTSERHTEIKKENVWHVGWGRPGSA